MEVSTTGTSDEQSNFDLANNTDLELVCDEITKDISTKSNQVAAANKYSLTTSALKPRPGVPFKKNKCKFINILKLELYFWFHKFSASSYISRL